MNKLLVFRLSIQSSYADNVEHEAEDDRFDTVQWWFSAHETWRIKTFAVDSDIHTYRIDGPIDEDFAKSSTAKNYSDVTAAVFSAEFADLNDPADVSRAMAPFGGAAALEVAKSGDFAFWNPSRVKYSSKTRPE